MPGPGNGGPKNCQGSLSSTATISPSIARLTEATANPSGCLPAATSTAISVPCKKVSPVTGETIATLGSADGSNWSQAGPQLLDAPALGVLAHQSSQLPNPTFGSDASAPAHAGPGAQLPSIAWQGVTSTPLSCSIHGIAPASVEWAP